MPHVPRHQIIYSVHGRDGRMSGIRSGLGRKGMRRSQTRPNAMASSPAPITRARHGSASPPPASIDVSRVIVHHDVDPSRHVFRLRCAPCCTSITHCRQGAQQARLVATARAGGARPRRAALLSRRPPYRLLGSPFAPLAFKPVGTPAAAGRTAAYPRRSGCGTTCSSAIDARPARTTVAGPATLWCWSMAGSVGAKVRRTARNMHSIR